MSLWRYTIKNLVRKFLMFNNHEIPQATKEGMQVLLSAPWYLNYISYGIDWPNYYQIDPQDFNGSNAQQRLVIGGEVNFGIGVDFYDV